MFPDWSGVGQFVPPIERDSRLTTYAPPPAFGPGEGRFLVCQRGDVHPPWMPGPSTRGITAGTTTRYPHAGHASPVGVSRIVTEHAGQWRPSRSSSMLVSRSCS